MVMVYLDRVTSSKAGHRIITWMVQLEMEKMRAYHLPLNVWCEMLSQAAMQDDVNRH
jgi:hypothetical protein